MIWKKYAMRYELAWHCDHIMMNECLDAWALMGFIASLRKMNSTSPDVRRVVLSLLFAHMTSDFLLWSQKLLCVQLRFLGNMEKLWRKVEELYNPNSEQLCVMYNNSMCTTSVLSHVSKSSLPKRKRKSNGGSF